ncbi:transglutaminase-like cysteine peptidase [Chitinimonas koreensis]|uniref:transglutaminase-like cysteine peptidase n=1 Tax=Chitinimonas koreensis TaxID=356302 RepID=UPI001FDF281B|nr:transglutaminase-like cysteine peptidase [Chitinimonas koreensis]
MLCLLMALAYTAPNYDRLLKTLNQRWGATPVARFQGWRDLIRDGAAGSDADRLKRVNDFFNRQLTFGDDPVIWNQPDYWATPLETIGRGAGDCEDFTIAKYFTLKFLGVTPEKLRLTYVKAKIGGADSSVSQAHMVLAYYAQPDAEPLVLDNLIGDIRPASRRPDLQPVFSFNSDGIWVPGGAQPNSSVDRLSRWKDLIARMRDEGFEL